MNIKINAEQLKTVGNYGVRIGKSIIFEGCKTMVLKSAKTVGETAFNEGLQSIKGLGWNDFLSDKEARTYKKLKKMEQAEFLRAENMKLKKQLAKEMAKNAKNQVEEILDEVEK